jgi:uncharacterized protein
MRLSLKLVATIFFYLLIALLVVGSSFIASGAVGILTYPTIILASLLFIMLLRLRFRFGSFVVGAVSAAAAMGLVLAVLFLSGSIVIGSLASDFIDVLAMGVLLQLLVGFGEELSFRASIFQGLSDELGLWPGAILSAIGFAALHIPSMDLLGIGAFSDFIALGTIFFAGIVLALLYAYGGLLNAIAFHFVWNFIEYNLFNLGPLSGAISVSKPGPVILTGGAFGPEASVVTLVVMALLSIALWYYYTKRTKKAGESTQSL